MDQVTPSQDLYLFTNEYPYGKGETFIENELIVLTEKFKQIYLFPLNKSGEARPLPVPSINVIDLFEKEHPSKWQLLRTHFFLISTILFCELQHLTFPKFIKSVATLKSILLINLHRAQKLEKYTKAADIKSVVFYCFWTDDWATVLSILKSKKKISHFISRVHGYDLYEERWPNKMIPFRHFQLTYVDRIIAASLDGLNYMKTHYPSHKEKFFLKHLNVFDKGTNPFVQDDQFVIVSCSNITPLKRVYLIPQLLKQLKFRIKWIHIGDGEGLSLLKEEIKLLPENINVELKGYMQNKELIQFYQNQQVNLFIHLSETEGGVPLVLQEAASFGIPLLATNVGGVSEIVTKETGLLIPVDFEMHTAIEQIKNIASSAINTVEFRAGVKSYWNENFNAAVNNNKLYNLISN